MFYKISFMLRLADLKEITFIVINFPYIFPSLLRGLGLSESASKAERFALFRLSQLNYSSDLRLRMEDGKI